MFTSLEELGLLLPVSSPYITTLLRLQLTTDFYFVRVVTLTTLTIPSRKMTRSFIPYQRRPPQLRQGAHSGNSVFPVAHDVRTLGEFPPSILPLHDRVARSLIDEVRRWIQWLRCHTQLGSATPPSPDPNKAVRLVGVRCGESSRLRLIRPRHGSELIACRADASKLGYVTPRVAVQFEAALDVKACSASRREAQVLISKVSFADVCRR